MRRKLTALVASIAASIGIMAASPSQAWAWPNGQQCSTYYVDTHPLLIANVCILRSSNYIQGNVRVENLSQFGMWVKLAPHTNISSQPYSGTLYLLPGQSYWMAEDKFNYDTTPNTPNWAIADIMYYGQEQGTNYWHTASRISAQG
jgi:hypothetical protein